MWPLQAPQCHLHVFIEVTCLFPLRGHELLEGRYLSVSSSVSNIHPLVPAFLHWLFTERLHMLSVPVSTEDSKVHQTENIPPLAEQCCVLVNSRHS